MNTRYGRSDRIRTCGIDVPNVARYQLRHTPKCEKYSIFRSFSVSGQICGQNILSVSFWKGKQPKKSVFTRAFSQWLQGFSWLCFSRGARFCPRGRPRCLHATKPGALPLAKQAWRILPEGAAFFRAVLLYQKNSLVSRLIVQTIRNCIRQPSRRVFSSYYICYVPAAICVKRQTSLWILFIKQ